MMFYVVFYSSYTVNDIVKICFAVEKITTVFNSKSRANKGSLMMDFLCSICDFLICVCFLTRLVVGLTRWSICSSHFLLHWEVLSLCLNVIENCFYTTNLLNYHLTLLSTVSSSLLIMSPDDHHSFILSSVTYCSSFSLASGSLLEANTIIIGSVQKCSWIGWILKARC